MRRFTEIQNKLEIQADIERRDGLELQDLDTKIYKQDE